MKPFARMNCLAVALRRPILVSSLALAAEGKDFNRAELNAMLDRLAASPEPKVRRGPQARRVTVWRCRSRNALSTSARNAARTPSIR